MLFEDHVHFLNTTGIPSLLRSFAVVHISMSSIANPRCYFVRVQVQMGNASLLFSCSHHRDMFEEFDVYQHIGSKELMKYADYFIEHGLVKSGGFHNLKADASCSFLDYFILPYYMIIVLKKMGEKRARDKIAVSPNYDGLHPSLYFAYPRKSTSARRWS